MTWKFLMAMLMVILLVGPALGCMDERPDDWDDELDGEFVPCNLPNATYVEEPRNLSELGMVKEQLKEATKRLDDMTQRMEEMQREVSIMNSEMSFINDVVGLHDYIMSKIVRKINETEYDEMMHEARQVGLSKPRKLAWEQKVSSVSMEELVQKITHYMKNHVEKNEQ